MSPPAISPAWAVRWPSPPAISTATAISIWRRPTSTHRSNNVAVLSNNGRGGFSIRAHTAGSNPIDVAIADVNLDGKPDLVVANALSSNISVLRGNGLGFLPAITVPAGLGGQILTSLAVGDLDRNGAPDVIVSSGNGDSIAVVLNNGLGQLGSPRVLQAGNFPADLALADLDGDRDLDLAVTNSNAPYRVEIYRNDGNGGLTRDATAALGAGPRGLVAADFTGEGIPDLAATELFPPRITVLRNRSNLRDESGRLDPRMLYASFLDGRHFEFLDAPLPEDVDALSAWKASLAGVR